MRYKGTTKYSGLINRINQMLCNSPEPMVIKEIFSRLVAAGELQDNDYFKFNALLVWVRRNGQVDKSRVIKGHGPKYKFKFRVGDKVRIDRNSYRIPQYLRDKLRLDTPRTIQMVFRQNGNGNTNAKTRYYLGMNRIGESLALESYPFRVDMLIPYVKCKVGRPRLKRRYNQNLVAVNR